MTSNVGRVLRVTLAVGIVGLVLVPMASAATLAKAVDFWGMAPDGLGARPAALGWTTDLGDSFNGTSGSNSGRGPSSNLAWSSWGASRATGSGDLWVPLERGVSISWQRYPARLSFSAPKTLSFATAPGGRSDRPSLVFTVVKVAFTSVVPAYWSRAASFMLTRISHGFYGFAFPS
jgi:hypothetical protein